MRYLSKRNENKNLQKISDSKILDDGANHLSDRFSGRGIRNSTRRQSKTLINKMIRLYDEEGTTKKLASYIHLNGRGTFDQVYHF